MLDVRDLTLRWEGLRALDDVTFQVERGQLAILVGAPGSGTTTLLRCLNGVETADEGTIQLDGAPLAPDEAAMLDQDAVVDDHSVLENVLDGSIDQEPIWRRLLGRHSTERTRAATALLEAIGLSDVADRPISSLSDLQRQQIVLARALHQQPQVLLADELAASVPPETVTSTLSVLASVVEQRDLVGVVSLQDPAPAADIADRYLGLVEGRLAFDAPPEMVSEEDLDAVTDQSDGSENPD